MISSRFHTFFPPAIIYKLNIYRNCLCLKCYGFNFIHIAYALSENTHSIGVVPLYGVSCVTIGPAVKRHMCFSAVGYNETIIKHKTMDETAKMDKK